MSYSAPLGSLGSRLASQEESQARSLGRHGQGEVGPNTAELHTTTDGLDTSLESRAQPQHRPAGRTEPEPPEA